MNRCIPTASSPTGQPSRGAWGSARGFLFPFFIPLLHSHNELTEPKSALLTLSGYYYEGSFPSGLHDSALASLSDFMKVPPCAPVKPYEKNLAAQKTPFERVEVSVDLGA